MAIEEMRPALGSWKRASRSSVVLFPAPLVPTSATTSPRRTVNDTSCNTGRSLV
jgi:hypothetical protein